MLQTTSEIKSYLATLKTDPKVVHSIVHDVDMNRASRIAWTAATPAEQKAFTAYFTDTLIHTYARLSFLH